MKAIQKEAYKAKHVIVNGHKFDSVTEGNFYTLACKAYGQSCVVPHPEIKYPSLAGIPDISYHPDFLLLIPTSNPIQSSRVSFEKIYIEIKGMMSKQMKGNAELARNMHLMANVWGQAVLARQFFIFHKGIQEDSPFFSCPNAFESPKNPEELKAFFRLRLG